MMEKETLHRLRNQLKAGTPLTRDESFALVNHGIQAYVEMEGGASAVLRRRELVERERQVRLALTDARAVLSGPDLTSDEQKIAYILDAVIEMLSAKGPAWRREWSWYRPRIDEEFGT